eukprot:EG_transcript_38942
MLYVLPHIARPCRCGAEPAVRDPRDTASNARVNIPCRLLSTVPSGHFTSASPACFSQPCTIPPPFSHPPGPEVLPWDFVRTFQFHSQTVAFAQVCIQFSRNKYPPK